MGKVLLAGTLVGALAAPGARAAEPGARAAEPGLVVRSEAEAWWTTPDPSGRHDTVEYWLWVRRLTRAGGEETVLRLTRYACDEVGDSGTYCEPTVQLEKTIPNDAFDLSAALDEASVRFRALGRTHSATWTATSQPGRSELDSSCGSVPIGNVARGAGRAAVAQGRILGHRLTTSDEGPGEDGYLSLMVETRTC